MITYGGRARVRIGHPMGQEAHMYIFRNGGELIQESIWQSEINLQDIHIETGVDYIDDQGSRTVVGPCLFFFCNSLFSIDRSTGLKRALSWYIIDRF